MKRKKTFYILRYIFAVVLIIGGLGNLSSSVRSAYALLLPECLFFHLSGI